MNKTEFFLLREIAVVAGTVIAAYTDEKKGLIFDWNTYPMILIGALLNVFEQNFEGFVAAGIVFAIGYVLYFTGRIGGGDVKLFTALAILLPALNGFPFVVNVLVFSGLFGLVFVSAKYSTKYVRKVGGIKKAFSENRPQATKALALGIALLFYFYFIYSSGLVQLHYVLLIGTAMLFGLFFLAFEKGIKEKIFLKKVPIEKLEEEEILATDFLDKKTREKLSLGSKSVIDRELEKKLKEAGIKEVPVYRSLPKFAVFILLGVLVTLFFPDFWGFRFDLSMFLELFK